MDGELSINNLLDAFDEYSVFCIWQKPYGKLICFDDIFDKDHHHISEIILNYDRKTYHKN